MGARSLTLLATRTVSITPRFELLGAVKEGEPAVRVAEGAKDRCHALDRPGDRRRRRLGDDGEGGAHIDEIAQYGQLRRRIAADMAAVGEDLLVDLADELIERAIQVADAEGDGGGNPAEDDGERRRFALTFAGHPLQVARLRAGGAEEAEAESRFGAAQEKVRGGEPVGEAAAEHRRLPSRRRPAPVGGKPAPRQRPRPRPSRLAAEAAQIDEPAELVHPLGQHRPRRQRRPRHRSEREAAAAEEEAALHHRLSLRRIGGGERRKQRRRLVRRGAAEAQLVRLRSIERAGERAGHRPSFFPRRRYAAPEGKNPANSLSG